MADFGCPFAYLQNMVDADKLPVEVLNDLKENYSQKISKTACGYSLSGLWKMNKKQSMPMLFAALQEVGDLQREIKKLKEENKKLKEINESFTSDTASADAAKDEVIKLLVGDRVKDQEKTIKKLKEQLEDVKEEYWEKGWHTGKCDTFDEIDKAVEPLNEEIKELKEENWKLQHDHERPMLSYKTFHSADSEDYIGWVKGCGIYQKLEAEVEELKDFSNWENHPALKHKVVLDDDYYLEHEQDGDLIDPDDFKKLQEENYKLTCRINSLHKIHEEFKQILTQE